MHNLIIKLFYFSFSFTLLILIVMILRRILGKKLCGESRIILWITVVLASLTSIYASSFKRTYLLSNSVVIPPIEINLYHHASGILKGIISIWNNGGWITYHFPAENIIKTILTVGLIGIIVLIIHQLIVYYKIHRAVRNIPKEQQYLHKQLINECRFYNIPKNIRIYAIKPNQIPYINCPSVINIIHPIILLPEPEWSELKEDERNAVLTHALMHIKYKDNLFNIFLILINALFWWNIFAYIGLKSFKNDIELLRDSQAIRNMKEDERSTYIKSVLSSKKMFNRQCIIMPYTGELCSSGAILRIKLINNYNRKSIIISIIFSILVSVLIIALFRTGVLNIIDYSYSNY